MKKIISFLCLLLLWGQSFAQEAKKPMANTLAVLPVNFVNPEKPGDYSDMAKSVHTYICSYLEEKQRHFYPVIILDQRKTNTLLRKAGITAKNLDEYGIDELEEILGVDHLIFTKVEQRTKKKGEKTTEGTIKDEGNKVKGIETVSTQEVIEYENRVFIDLYKGGEKVYSKSFTPFFDGPKGWQDSVDHLLKKSPIYKK